MKVPYKLLLLFFGGPGQTCKEYPKYYVLQDLKGSLHTTVFSTYTELLQLKIFLEYFDIIFEIF